MSQSKRIWGWFFYDWACQPFYTLMLTFFFAPYFATVAAESGADERSIMTMTGHKTTQMVRRYIREANIFKNNALNKLKI